ncbi:DNA polymerase zeta [Dimargaris verticillata]|uniref:DNA polymerase zeta catalytic subunit n=1 Tax=Dimargaris verticillata TaxID=2761393 RepID=A0A9W8EDR0_9FUNG|nr:DNA polymerase zeta [Dimargaris verticillata]
MACRGVAQLIVRLTHLDYYLSDALHPQWDALPGNAATDVLDAPLQAPIVRIFGRTADTQQTVCVHVHGVWPYLYIPCIAQDEEVDAERAQLALSLNQALTTWLHHSAPAEQDTGGSVAGIVRVRATPFYGYAVGERYFWKIYLVNPTHKGVVASLLRRGVVMDTRFDVYESHIPYILQFMVDCNVAGMDWVHLAQCWQRSPDSLAQTPLHLSPTTPTPHLTTHTINPAIRPGLPLATTHSTGSNLAPQQVTRVDQTTADFPLSPYATTAWCAMEIDITAGSLLDHHWIVERLSHHQVQVSSPLTPSRPLGLVPSLEAIRSLVREFRATYRTPTRATVRASQPWDPNHTESAPTSVVWANHEYLQAIVYRILAQKHATQSPSSPPPSVSFNRLCRPDSLKDSCTWYVLHDQLTRCWALHSNPQARVPVNDQTASSDPPLACNCPTAFQASRYSPAALAQKEHEATLSTPIRHTPHKPLAITPLKVNEALLHGLVATPLKPAPRQSPLFRSPWNHHLVTTSPLVPYPYDQLLSQMTCPVLSPNHLPDETEQHTNQAPNPNDSDGGASTDSEIAEENVWEALRSIASPPTSPDHHRTMTIPQLDGADDRPPSENSGERRSSVPVRGRRQGRYRSVLKQPSLRSPSNNNAPLRTPRLPKIQLVSTKSSLSSTNRLKSQVKTPIQRTNHKFPATAGFPTLELRPLAASSQQGRDDKRSSWQSPATRCLATGTLETTERTHLSLTSFTANDITSSTKEYVAASMVVQAGGLDIHNFEGTTKPASNDALDIDSDNPFLNEAKGIDASPTPTQPLLFSSPSLWTPPACSPVLDKTHQAIFEDMPLVPPLKVDQDTHCPLAETGSIHLVPSSTQTPKPTIVPPKPHLTTRDLFETPISQLPRALAYDQHATPSRAPKSLASVLPNLTLPDQSTALPSSSLTSPIVFRQVQQITHSNPRALMATADGRHEARPLCSPDLYATPEMDAPSLYSTPGTHGLLLLGTENDSAEVVEPSPQLPKDSERAVTRSSTDAAQEHLNPDTHLPEFPHALPTLSKRRNANDFLPIPRPCTSEHPANQGTFICSAASKEFCYAVSPPLPSDLLRSMASYQLPAVVYQPPYKVVEATSHKPANDTVESHQPTKVIIKPTGHCVPLVALNTIRTWAWAQPPPTPTTIRQWIHQHPWQLQGNVTCHNPTSYRVQSLPATPSCLAPAATRPTPSAHFLSQPSPTALAPILMSILSLEIHVNTRGSLWPDPSLDAVQCIFCSLWTPREANLAIASTNSESEPCTRTAYVLYWPSPPDGAEACVSPRAKQHDSPPSRWSKALLASCRQITPQVHLLPASSERAMLDQLITLVTRHWDPDVLTGYDVDRFSWGYIIDRAAAVYQQNLTRQLGRIKACTLAHLLDTDISCCSATAPGQSPYADNPNTNGPGRDDDQAADHPAAQWQAARGSPHAVAGRHVLNLWRVLKEACGTSRRSFEHDVYHLLDRRVPHYAFATLTQWYTHRLDILRCQVFQYYIERAELDHQLLDASEVIHHKSNFSKVYGIDFYAALTRGSQFKVEAMLLRITKPENFVMLSPSAAQVARQPATEYIPLVMEPQSGFYTSPMLVLDFQSLYPSIMIAYNYCYSTCLGPLSATSARPMGVTQLDLPPALVATLAAHHQLQVAPNGVGYVKASVRQGLLGRMLTELLDTRIGIKDHMKEMDRLMADAQAATTSHPSLSQATLAYRRRQMDACQLALKLLANVTYGYAGASFSGRMPCSTLADSIVSTAREILEKTIRTINEHPTWQARVVYGDTDSVFVYLPGSTRDRAFAIGQEIAATITQHNPAPVKLKFEKVYHPCILLTKKRYVGHKYEHPHQTRPTFEAKGTEAIRRDGCPVVQRIAEQCLTRIFTDPDITALRAYLQREWAKILSGRIAIPEYTFSKAVKLRNYSEGRLPPPSVIVALKAMAKDPRRVPAHGERVPYVVVYGGPNDRLADQIADPRDLLDNSRLRIHGRYYITRQLVPVLNRYLSLLQIDVGQWFAEMSKSFTNPQLVLSGINPPLRLPPLSTASDQVRRLLEARRPEARHRAPPTNETVSVGDLVSIPRGQPTIDQFYQSRHCLACWSQSDYHLCDACQARSQLTGLQLMSEIRAMDRCQLTLNSICHQCSRLPRSYLDQPAHQSATCDSIDCPIFYQRAANRLRLQSRVHYYQIMDWLDAKTVDQWLGATSTAGLP